MQTAAIRIHRKMLMYRELGNISEFMFNNAIACQSMIAILAAYTATAHANPYNIVVAVLNALVLTSTQISDQFSLLATKQNTTLQQSLVSTCSVEHPFPFISTVWSRRRKKEKKIHRTLMQTHADCHCKIAGLRLVRLHHLLPPHRTQPGHFCFALTTISGATYAASGICNISDQHCA